MMDNYKTTNWILRLIDNYYDPCPFDETPKIDGLKTDWEKRTFVNPPYSDPLPWILKAIEENKKGKFIILLLRLDCSTEWFRRLVQAKAHILFINERVRFNGKTPPFCNMIAILE